jgi:hypothetical protein
MEKLILNPICISYEEAEIFVRENFDSLELDDIKNLPEYDTDGLNHNALGSIGADNMKYETLMSLSIGNFIVDMEIGITNKNPECNFRIFKKDSVSGLFADTSDKDCIDFVCVKKYSMTDNKYLSDMYLDISKRIQTNSSKYVEKYYEGLWNVLKKYIKENEFCSN